MLKALIRFIILELPSCILRALAFIIFDKDEIIGVSFQVRRQWRPDIRKRVLIEYLNRCSKQVNDEKKERKDN